MSVKSMASLKIKLRNPSLFWMAVRESMPIMCGIIPFGITCGVMGLTSGLNPIETVLMSALVFAGASQFIAIDMLGAGITGFGVIIFTTLMVNLRHLLMGASLAPHITKLPLSLQGLLAFGLVDESYALTANQIHRGGYSALYQAGAQISLYVIWVLSTMTGIIIGGRISNPMEWGLDFAMPATFLVLLIPRLADRVSLYVCGISAMLAVIGAQYLPGKWYIIIACVVATIVGGLLERREENEE